MTFLRTVATCVGNLQWIRSQKHETKKALQYATFFLFVVMVLRFSPLVLIFPQAISELDYYLRREMPDFSVELKKGELSVERLPQPFVRSLGEENTVESLTIVVDTSTTSTDVRSYLRGDKESGLMLGKNWLTLYDGETKETRQDSWGSVPDFKFTREELVRRVEPFVGRTAFLLSPIIIILLSLVFALGNFIDIVFVAAVAYALARIYKKAWSFKEIFTVSLYAATAPVLLQMSFGGFGFMLPLAFSALLLTYLAGIIFVDKDVRREG